jgi:hypothetical protein
VLEHHRATIERANATISAREETLAVLVGGSIAHGFDTPASDVDVMIVVSEADYRRRLAAGDMMYWETESATYDGGYVDGKYISVDYIRTVAERGNEPSRFAFDGAIIASSRLPELAELVASAARYPVAQKRDKLVKFQAQLEYWHWLAGEGFRSGSGYVLSHAAPNLALFAGRMILAHNETLYPYHKWFLRVLAGVERKPEGLLMVIDRVIRDRDQDSMEELYRDVIGFTDWPGKGMNWGAQFAFDTELAWIDGKAAIGDL